MEVVVGIDAGTTSTKAVTAGADGTVRDVAGAAYPLLVPQPGWAELDPRRLQAAAVQALVEVTALARERGDDVVGVVLCAAMHGLVPLSADGTPTGPLVTWADGRAATSAAELHHDGRGAGLHARTGTPVHPMSPLTKLHWLGAHEPDARRSTARWGGVKELLVTALCQAGHVVDLSCASATGLLNLEQRRWDDEAVDVAGVRLDQLPEVLPTTQTLPLRPDVAQAAGLLPTTPVVLGASDGVLATLGTGALLPGVGAVSIGTSAALRAVALRPTVDPSGRLFCYALTDERWVLGGAVNNGGSVVRWAALALAAADGPPPEGEDADALDARLLEEAAGVPPGSEGLLCLPYLLGERAPWWRPGLSGAYLGLRRDHRRGHLVRAVVEGVCQQLALVREALDDVGCDLTQVHATGGAVASPLWTSVLAAALGRPVRVADSPEGTGLGACLLGWFALERIPDLDAATRLVEVGAQLGPDAGAAAAYARTRPLVEQSVTALAAVLAALEHPPG